MIIHNDPQGSAEWLARRAGCITASRFKDARDRLKPAKGEAIGKPSAKCTAYAAQVAVERIAGRPIDKTFENWQMREGTEQEPAARAAYDVETGNIVYEAGLITTDDGRYGYSSDGLIGADGLLEIKTLLSGDRIVKIIGEGDLSDFIDQCMGGLWLTGRKWIDLALWCPALETIGRQLTIHHIERDESHIEALEADLIAFAEMIDACEKKLRMDDVVDAEIERELAQESTP
jgi:hypothetical protein